MSTAPLLQVRGVARRYAMRRGLLGRSIDVRAVDGVSLTVERGRTLGLVGESGSGKSTTGRLALGLEPPDDGDVLFKGAPIPPAGTLAWRQLRARMQMIYQDPLGALDRRLSILEQVREPYDVHGIGEAGERNAMATALLQAVGLRADQGNRYPHELSGGQRQRAVIARALATKPDLLVCDEPVSALDVSIQAQVINLFMDVRERHGLTYLFVSHDLGLVRHISDRVAIMYLGRIVEIGSATAIFAEPAHPYSAALIKAIPSAARRKSSFQPLKGELPSPLAPPPGCPFHPRCEHAMAVCREVRPDLTEIAPGCSAACHLHTTAKAA